MVKSKAKKPPILVKKTNPIKKKKSLSAEATALLEKKQAELQSLVISQYPLIFMKFNQPQRDFLYCKNRNGRTPKRRLFEAGNKEGKCVTYSTLIDTPDGKISIGELYEKSQPFEVYAWDGEKKVVAQASPPFKKEGLHDCYKISLSDGQWIEAADKHRLLTSFLYQTVSNIAFSFRTCRPIDVLWISPQSSIIAGVQPQSIEYIGKQEVYDFEVPEYHNYFAGGLINHNTYVGIAEDIAHAFGHRPWLNEEHQDYKIDINVPNIGLIGCETIAHSVPEKIEPMLKMLIPDICKPVWKLGPTGALKKVTITYDELGKECGSVIYVRSYDEHESTYEGIDYNFIHWDEPPPQKVLKAAERGKVVTNAPSWFTMTPLKEPYIYDQFTLNAYTHGGLDDEIAVIRGSIWDNCRNFCWYCNKPVSDNDETRTTPRCPQCNRLMGFIPKAGIDEYLKTLDPEEREAREFGTWHHLSGLVYKEMKRDTHVYQDFPIPYNWMRVEGVDPHDARATCWLFAAVAPEEIEVYGKPRNRIYVYDYLSLEGNLDDMVRQIRAKRIMHGYSEPAFVVLDKKFGEKTQMEERSWENELSRRGIHRIRLSHSSPGDVELGHKLVKEYLKLHYSALLGLAKPGVLFAKEGCGGRGGPLHFMFNYQYKEGKSKPEEEYKDWPDCLRYICMEQPVYREPEEYRNDIRKIAERNKQSVEMRRNILRATA